MQVTKLNSWTKRFLTMVIAVITLFALTPQSPIAGQQVPMATTQGSIAPDTPEQLQQLVAPIALYPDELVAEILAASTYATEVVQADRWLQENSQLQGEQLGAAVDRQPWDPSVKALTAFPSVLANLDQNLSWTEALGNAYFSQQQDVLDAVQVMRQRAEAAGSLQTTLQERVLNEGTTIVIEPAIPDVCYVPIYDPWIVYGAPFEPYPGYFYEGWYGPPYVSFGPAISLGFFGGFGWSWPAWGFNWGRRVVVFNRNVYVSRSPYFINRPFVGTRAVAPFRANAPARVNPSFNNRVPIAPSARFGNSWSNRTQVTPRAYGSRVGAFNGARSNQTNQGPAIRGAPGVGRPSFGSSARGFGGGARGGGSSRRRR